ncbi:MAG TPA: xanthine dehydrogenase family protein subunit M [Terriglobales bacterium]
MYPRAFQYHRAASISEASTLLSQLGDEAKLLAGGQSLIPLMKLRFANPAHLVDLGFVPGLAFIKEDEDGLHFGPMTRHAEIEHSQLAAKIPIVRDCAAGIADVQIRNRGTIGGSLAEADPSGDWANVLLTLDAQVRIASAKGKHSIPLSDFIKDAYTTALAHDELITEITVRIPAKNSGGAYLAFKRTAPVYPTASVAVQLVMEGDTCTQAAIVLGCVGLTPVKATEAEVALRGKPLNAKTLMAAADAASTAADPQTDMRGSADYKRTLVAALTKRAIEAAGRRARGQQIEVSHRYA